MDSTKERIYVAVGDCVWGKGLTIEAAKWEAKNRTGKKRQKFNVYKMPDGAHSVYVDDFGAVCWSGSTERPEHVVSLEKKHSVPASFVKEFQRALDENCKHDHYVSSDVLLGKMKFNGAIVRAKAHMGTCMKLGLVSGYVSRTGAGGGYTKE